MAGPLRGLSANNRNRGTPVQITNGNGLIAGISASADGTKLAIVRRTLLPNVYVAKGTGTSSFEGFFGPNYPHPHVSSRFGNGYCGCGWNHPRTVYVIHDAFDPLRDHVETDG